MPPTASLAYLHHLHCCRAGQARLLASVEPSCTSRSAPTWCPGAMSRDASRTVGHLCSPTAPQPAGMFGCHTYTPAAATMATLSGALVGCLLQVQQDWLRCWERCRRAGTWVALLEDQYPSLTEARHSHPKTEASRTDMASLCRLCPAGSYTACAAGSRCQWLLMAPELLPHRDAGWG